jgi:hypothetical protein
MVSIYRFRFYDTLMFKASDHAFRVYISHYSRRPLQHTVIIHRSSHEYLHVVIVRGEGKGETVVTLSDRLDGFCISWQLHDQVSINPMGKCPSYLVHLTPLTSVH